MPKGMEYSGKWNFNWRDAVPHIGRKNGHWLGDEWVYSNELSKWDL